MTISFLGILLGVGLFIFLVFKGTNMVFSSMVGAVIMMIASQLPILESVKTIWMAGFAGFMKAYFLLFVLSALFGKIMNDGGAAKRIALTLANVVKKSKGDKKFLTVLILPVFYFILSYVGVSGFVTVFTVVAIGRELYEQCDVPWQYYCYGSAGIYPAIILGGSLQAANIIPMSAFGTYPTAGFGLSLIAVIVVWIVLILIMKADVRKSDKNGEGFLPTGAATKALKIDEGMDEKDLPSFTLSIIPLLVPIVCIAVLKTDVLVALGLGIVVAFILFLKKVKSLKGTLSSGIVAAAVPIINVSAAVGLTTLVKASPGFKVITDALGGLPPMFQGVGLAMLATAMVASSSSSLPTFLPIISENLIASGLSAPIMHRLVTISGFTYMMPHSAGIVNAVSLTKLDYKRAAWTYFKGTTIPGLAAFITCIILIKLGVFI